MDSDWKRLGTNIQALRKAFGESLEHLGNAIYVGRSAISNYEAGIRYPDSSKIQSIADHYLVSEFGLRYDDLSGIKPVPIKKDFFWKNIESFYPLISTKTALRDKSFRIAYHSHKSLYNQLHELNFVGLDLIENYLENYWESYCTDNKDVSSEAAANLYGLLLIPLTFCRVFSMFSGSRPALISVLAEKDIKFRDALEESAPLFQEASEVLSNVIKDAEINARRTEILTKIKKSNHWSELADYYLALQYETGLVDNGLPRNVNQRIGVEMMSAFCSIKNKYALQYRKTSNAYHTDSK